METLNLKKLKDAFNDSRGSVRILAVLSPT